MPHISIQAPKINASIKSFALLHIVRAKYQSNLLKNIQLTWTFTCFTLKQFGALTKKMIMIVRLVYMHTTGRTIEENLHFTTTPKKCVLNGKLIKLLLHTRKVVHINTSAKILMVGKSRNITQSFSRSKNVSTLRGVKRCIVPTSIQRLTKGLPFQAGFTYSQKQESIPSQQTSMYQHLVVRRIKWQTSRQVSPGFQLKLYVIKISS